jgi:hypothetical protein
MTNAATQTLAAIAALFLTISSIGAIVTVPPTNAASTAQSVELA